MTSPFTDGELFTIAQWNDNKDNLSDRITIEQLEALRSGEGIDLQLVAKARQMLEDAAVRAVPFRFVERGELQRFTSLASFKELINVVDLIGIKQMILYEILKADGLISDERVMQMSKTLLDRAKNPETIQQEVQDDARKTRSAPRKRKPAEKEATEDKNEARSPRVPTDFRPRPRGGNRKRGISKKSS